jgi:hypothetical protein
MWGCGHAARTSTVSWGTVLQAQRVQFPVRSLDIFSVCLPPPAVPWPWGIWGVLNLQQIQVPGIFRGGGKAWPLLKADNLTAICEPIVCNMWDPQLLTTPWASTACYRNSFTIYFWGQVDDKPVEEYLFYLFWQTNLGMNILNIHI